jgi:hypothetical protein
MISAFMLAVRRYDTCFEAIHFKAKNKKGAARLF